MKAKCKRELILSIIFLGLFLLLTFLIQIVDRKPIGANGTLVGFATLNGKIHEIIGVNMTLYVITDWLGLVPIFICMGFGVLGVVQLVKEKNLFKVDLDIFILGFYYIIVIIGYLVFEMIPINYRPILINGYLEPSYPSSTTLLVLSVMPTLTFEIRRRIKSVAVKRVISLFVITFSAFMLVGRLVSGVHWFTDIAGALFLSLGLFYGYKFLVFKLEKRKILGGKLWN